ncbi:hypothetical protein PPERSA_10901 [Pseudocohnilembus persalinus]|uniref:Transmembrane protein n=1 Tax=Pseudocohnilembus persalinus TaxID=266149 RepID=A0A0V0R9J2_PSEPJ|nr:hypothetical protein PPERSA_10901 [Pseudocohnilembus persalinus]|eukprot:KRX11134.1 hypothetical protein PPERSA_10901 [Pseudocohnilembus persalinus]
MNQTLFFSFFNLLYNLQFFHYCYYYIYNLNQNQAFQLPMYQNLLPYYSFTYILNFLFHFHQFFSNFLKKLTLSYYLNQSYFPYYRFESFYFFLKNYVHQLNKINFIHYLQDFNFYFFLHQFYFQPINYFSLQICQNQQELKLQKHHKIPLLRFNSNLYFLALIFLLL